MYTSYPKDLNVRFAHHTNFGEDEFDELKLFTPIRNRESLLDDVHIDDNTRRVLRRSIGATMNKPECGTGSWVSPIHMGGYTEWYKVGPMDPSPVYYEIIPTEDCRILVVDTIEKLLLVDNEYRYDFERLSKDFDLIYVSQYNFMSVTASIFDEEIKSIEEKLINPAMFYGWDCISGVFLNPKFTVGERCEIPRREK